MDFYGWGEEYLQEAKVIKARVDTLRHLLKRADAEQAKELNDRICLLYPMYLDCRSTGRFLQRRARGKGGAL